MSHESDPVPVCWLSREDLVACRPDLADQLEVLSENELANLVDRLGEALQETYWIAVAVILETCVEPEVGNDAAPHLNEPPGA